jgi:ligand-binding sensor domain-containing protein
MLSGLLLACPVQSRAAVPETPRLRAIGVDAGMPSSGVNAIARDRDGYIWVATPDGLARYDGLGFRTWRHDPADPGSLPGNNVQALHVDAQDRVWVATEGGGISVLDRDRARFRQYRKATDAAIGSDDTWAIASDGGALWFGTWGGGLHRLDADGRITRFMPVPGDAHSLPAETVLALARDRDGVLWIGTTHGLARWRHGVFDRVAMPGRQHAPLVYALSVEADGLWIGTDAGLHHRDANGRWRDPPWAERFARPNAMMALARDREGGFWIGSQQGLWRVGDAGQPVPVPLQGTGASRAVAAVLQDDEGAMWTSIPGVGLGYLRADWRGLAQFGGAATGGVSGQYRAVAPARAGGIWLAPAAGAPLRLDRSGHLHAAPAAVRAALRDRRVRAVAEDASGVAWAGGRDTLARFDHAGRVRAWHPDSTSDPLPGAVDLLLPGPDGTVWLSCAGVGVQQRHADGSVLRDWRAGGHGLGSADIEAMAFASDGSLWIAGDGGVAAWRKGASGFRAVPAMGRARVYAFAFDGPGTLWLSRPTGLERYRLGTDGWRLAGLVGAGRGLPPVEAAGLVVDARHRAWLSTTRGLYLWDPARGRARRYGLQDGLSSQEFAARGLALAGDGLLAALTDQGGVVLVDTTAPQPPPRRPRLRLAEVAVRDSGHWRALPPGPIDLPARTRELRVRMRLLAFADPRGNRYETLLEGGDRQWQSQEGGERVIAGLRPGEFRLRMRASDAAGNLSAPQSLRWRVLPPWWRTPWALASSVLLAALLAAGLAAGLRVRGRERRRTQRAEQERALAMQASMEKSRFLATLGHEVRTPMAGVLGMSELLLDSALGAHQRRHVEAIRGAGRHLLRLLDDALDMARIEAGKLALDLQPFAVRALVAEVEALQAPLAHARGLRFIAAVDADAPPACRGDVLRIRQVLFNLVGNAIKFTQHGEVVVRAAGLPGHCAGVRFTVHDTGPGMDEAQQARLFRRFEQGDGARTATRYGGSGLGLAISQELVAAMGGCIRVHGVRGVGTRFVVDLPLAPAFAAPA